jgi:hypothetical protein
MIFRVKSGGDEMEGNRLLIQRVELRARAEICNSALPSPDEVYIKMDVMKVCSVYKEDMKINLL